MKSIIRDLPHYMLLMGILLTGFAGLILFSYDKNFQTAIAISLALTYIGWGVIHHHLHKDLHPETVLEYTAVAILGFVIIFSLIVRS